jgi:hypothetical protein
MDFTHDLRALLSAMSDNPSDKPVLKAKELTQSYSKTLSMSRLQQART